MLEHHQLAGTLIDELALSIDVPSGVRDIVIGVKAGIRGPVTDRPALIAYKLIDELGNVSAPNGHHYRSPHVGYFFYLEVEEGDENPRSSETVKVLSVPPGVVRIELSGRHWTRGVTAFLDELVVAAVPEGGLGASEDSDVPQWLLDGVPRRFRSRWGLRFPDRGPVEPGNGSDQIAWSLAKEIVGAPLALDANRDAYRSHGSKEAHRFKVALICDEFTFNSFSPEFEYAILEPGNWRETLEEFEPDFLFCESTWSGVDSHRRPWRGQVYASVKFPRENRGALLSILAYCREKSIPSVFWNKEDPTHYHDRVNDFVSTASRFDYVLTTAEEVLDEYRKFLPDDRVGVLQFAAQPRDFNPLHVGELEERAVFAGAWYDIHERRSETMRQGFDSVLEAGIPLVIHDRNLRSLDRETNFPAPYDSFVSPAISHKATAKVYRNSKFGLNFNTVTDSRTMFARRVFELAASNALVVSNFSPGIECIYGDDVYFYDRTRERLEELTEKDVLDKTARAFRVTMTHHTYRQRFEQILQFLGLKFTSSRPAPTMMSIVSSFGDAEEATRAFRARKRDFSRLLLVVSREVPSSRTGKYYAEYAGPDVDVVSQELISTERVPSTNFLRTPDIIWVDGSDVPAVHEIKALMMHGEYSRLPMGLGHRDRPAMTARALGPGLRLSAIDVIPALTEQSTVRPVLEVTR
ncbi:CgeB family protein [Brachybacterium sp. AOP42-C2-15]|uniref:CgeB family protein n=1 Tax=Brachybacterium sp. AOP42-C2-15 TaxID=3457670 RepID=UPI00403353DB